MKKKHIIFIDRDGTINHDVDYCDNPDKLELIDRSAEAIRLVNDSPFFAVVITNQSGVGRGYFPEYIVHDVNDRLLLMLEEEGSHIDKTYYCPHHPEAKVEEYRQVCGCRKPNTAMLEQGAKELGVELAGSYMIGDRYSDVATGHNAGICSVMVMTGYGERESSASSSWKTQPDYIAKNLYDAVTWILSKPILNGV